MTNTGFISIMRGGRQGRVIKGFFYPRMKRVEIEIVERFSFKGHIFIIHHPYNKESSEFVVTHELTGCIASQLHVIKFGETIQDYTTHISPERAKQFVIDKINQYESSGKSFNEMVKKMLRKLALSEPLGYIKLKITKII